MSAERKTDGCLIALWMIAVLMVGFILIGLGACRSVQYVPVESVRHDSVVTILHQRDSIYLHDSIHIREKADTILIEKWHTKYIEKIKMDTLIQIERDTIPQPYPYEVEVPAQLSWWQETRLHLANIALLALAVFIAWEIYRRKW